MYIESRIPQIIPTSECGRRSNLAFIEKSCKHVPKNGLANNFIQWKVFQRQILFQGEPT